jgi:ubiquitin carboxyl-terminal hydrolase L5
MIRDAHNSLARYVDFAPHPMLPHLYVILRPADLRGALRTVAKSAIDESKARSAKPQSLKRSKAGDTTKSGRKFNSEAEEQEEAYHFIGYLPTHGRVWELDGLKSGPIEVGEIPATTSTSELARPPATHPTTGWMDVVRPALRMKMRKYGGAAEGGNIRFSLLALVNGRYQAASDELEFLKREKNALERRLNEEFPNGWHDCVRMARSRKHDPLNYLLNRLTRFCLTQP